MNADVARAVRDLAGKGLLPLPAARHVLRVARGELVGVRLELRLLLYAGVLLITGGVGLLVRQSLHHIGPVTVAVAIGLAAAACLAAVVRQAQPFSRGEVPSPHVGFDYLLLLGALLAAADLAFVEVKFTPLGASWPWHLIFVAAFYAALAFRYDSRTLFSLALAAFAAWRGVSVWSVIDPLGPGGYGRLGDRLTWNAIGCGIAFVAAGEALRRARWKAHFEPVATYMGIVLALGALLNGVLDNAAPFTIFTAVLAAGGAGLIVWGRAAHRFGILAFGVLAVYAAVSRIAVSAPGIGVTGIAAWFVVSSIAVVVTLQIVHRRWGDGNAR